MADDLGDRTEDATPKRRQEAREEGNLAKSADMAAAVMLLGAVGALWLGVMPMLGQLKMLVGSALGGDAWGGTLRPDEVLPLAALGGQVAIKALAPIVLASWAIAYGSYALQVGLLLAPKALQPKASRLNPLQGMARVVGKRALGKAGIDTLKLATVMVVGGAAILDLAPRIASLPNLPLMGALASIGDMMLAVALKVVVVLLIVGFLDFMWQRWKHENDLKMTKQQVKDEYRQNEGDPDVKRRRLRMAQQIAMQRIGAAVPKADVVVTNPEHFAVAISYQAESMHAPKVVAKGADHLALRIRQLAAQHGVPVVERKPLARALYRDCEVGQEIPAAHYQAVAELLAYVYRLAEGVGRKSA
ncbi:MAG: EscU/YscU/HrcU family type III secretion system export apparatus switch protein [Phycisphaerales bacterium]|nr:EscU/YscU/HrcU family type III secretion system export apparatus switch protein [Phycisphaerales bacterium]